MANWKGTAVPNSGLVENVYFNTSLSVDEVVGLLENLTLNYCGTGELLTASSLNEEGTAQMISILKMSETSWVIQLNTYTDSEFLFISSDDFNLGYVGWNPNITYPIVLGFELQSSLEGEDDEGNVGVVPIGTQNAQLSSLFSTTPFVKGVSLNSFLTGIADAIRTKTETTEPINAQDFATEILNIKTGDTETEDGIIDRTITKITNNRVEKIGSYAFVYCSNLTEANFPNCSRLYEYAFSGTSISKITLSKCLEIDRGVFSSCKKLEECNLPECSKIDSYAFGYCSNLSIVNIPKCTSIGNNAFYSTKIQNISIPQCSKIEYSAFANATFLTDIYAPLITRISSGVFYTCKSLKNVTMPYIFVIESSAFYGCNSLDKLEFFTYSINLFSSNCFAYTPFSASSYLGYYGSIYVPTSAVEIFKSKTNWAVYADRITNLPSANDSKYIYAYEFYYNSSMTEIPEERKNVEIVLSEAFTKATAITSVYLPNCSLISSRAFTYCSMSTVDLPLCKEIKEYGFLSCRMSQVNLPVCEIVGNGAFASCESLNSISISNCKYIGSRAFERCTNLRQINLPNCEKIEATCFSQTALSKINLPKVNVIASSAFYSCYSLITASFQNCSIISWYAFASCQKLKSLYLNVKSLVTLKDVNVFSSTPMVSSWFYGYYGSIYVPTSLHESFITAENWSVYADRIVAMDFDD